jgi:hypothetical protein
MPIFRPVYQAVAEADLINEVSRELDLFFSGELTVSEAALSFGASAESFFKILYNFNGIVVFGYIFVGFLFVLIGFFRATFDIAAAAVLNGFMSAKMRVKLLPEYFRHIAKLFGYAAVKIVFSSVVSVLIIVLLTAFVWLTFGALSFISVALAIAAHIALFSLKFALFAEWIPNMLEGDGLRAALKKSLNLKNSKGAGGFESKFFTALCFYAVLAVCVLSFSIPTFGLVLILIFPIHSCFLRAMELVNYYVSKSRKFYSDDYTVVNSD